MKLISKLVTPRSVFVLLEGQPPLQTNDTNPNFAAIVAALDAGDYAALPDLFSPKASILTYGKGLFNVVGNTVYIEGEPVVGIIVDRILDAIKTDRDPMTFVRFQSALKRNPSYRVREQLYGFIEASKSIGLSADGMITAFKVVRMKTNGDLVSIHDNTTKHNVGMTVSMERTAVDDDPTRTCSSGLHACSENYLSHFGGSDTDYVIAVLIDPAAVVSVPVDYENAKMRVCKYKVLSILGKQQDIVKDVPNLDTMAFEDDDTGATSDYDQGHDDEYAGGSMGLI